MNEIARKKMVVAMEYIARQINDEDIFMSWLMCGVADGDIKSDSLDLDEVDDWYIGDDTFKDLMECFLGCMARASKDGGLYCDKVVAERK